MVNVVNKLTENISVAYIEEQGGFRVERRDSRLDDPVTAVKECDTQFEAERVASRWMVEERHD